MKITVSGEDFSLDPGSLTNKEVMDLERTTGMTFGEWRTALLSESMLAVTGAVWMAMRRSRPGLKFDEVEFRFSDVAFEDDSDPTNAGATSAG